jgi:hypothetical protein
VKSVKSGLTKKAKAIMIKSKKKVVRKRSTSEAAKERDARRLKGILERARMEGSF